MPIIKTRYGQFKYEALDRNTVVVDANERCGDDPTVGLTFFGVRYGVHGFLRRKTAEESFLVRERDVNDPYPRLYMSRATSGGGEPSFAARKAAVAVLETEVNKYITEIDLLKAEIKSNEYNIRRKTEKIIEKAEELKGMEQELNELVAHGKRLEEEWASKPVNV